MKKNLRLIILIALVPISMFFYKEFSFQTKTVVDTPKTLMKHLPPEEKREIEKRIVSPTPITIGRQIKQASLAATIRVPIFLYHYVENVQDKKDKIRVSLNIPPNIFEQQVQTLVNAGYTFMTAKELGDVLDGRMQLPPKPILITFDDGHWDFATDVLPILKKYQVKATQYVIPGFTGGSDFMTQTQVQEVINSGLVDIGAHTVHHISLKGKLLPIVQYEVNQSKSMLEHVYHIHVVSFAYPNGFFDAQAVQVVRAAGFSTAVSTLPGIEQNQQNRFYLYRLRPGYRTRENLLLYLQQNIFKAY
ncbi:MAG TPA: polysaccharide deacetylase family protein [Candidatus Saccharimonadales bacterium]|nr:polysaccharide deacetylase family protein [Candidatus Saccharimonadales bacterium]